MSRYSDESRLIILSTYNSRVIISHQTSNQINTTTHLGKFLAQYYKSTDLDDIYEKINNEEDEEEQVDRPVRYRRKKRVVRPKEMRRSYKYVDFKAAQNPTNLFTLEQQIRGSIATSWMLKHDMERRKELTDDPEMQSFLDSKIRELNDRKLA